MREKLETLPLTELKALAKQLNIKRTTGIRKADLSVIRSRRMLNMDCGDPDVLVIGAAGGSKYDLTASFPLAATDDPGLCVEIAGLRGGHSGIEAGKNRASSVDLAGRLLSALCDELPIRLAAMETPTAANGFPRWQRLFLAVPDDRADDARRVLAYMDGEFRRELADVEPDYRMTVEDHPVAEAASAADTRALADFLLWCPSACPAGPPTTRPGSSALPCWPTLPSPTAGSTATSPFAPTGTRTVTPPHPSWRPSAASPA